MASRDMHATRRHVLAPLIAWSAATCACPRHEHPDASAPPLPPATPMHFTPVATQPARLTARLERVDHLLHASVSIACSSRTVLHPKRIILDDIGNYGETRRPEDGETSRIIIGVRAVDGTRQFPNCTVDSFGAPVEEIVCDSTPTELYSFQWTGCYAPPKKGTTICAVIHEREATSGPLNSAELCATAGGVEHGEVP